MKEENYLESWQRIRWEAISFS